MSILNAAAGEELNPLVKPPITQEQLRRYADASGDHNPIHLDEDAAHSVGLDGVIAHGMLSMAFLGQFVMQQISDTPGAYLSQLKVRFMGMVRLGDTLTCHGIVKARSDSDEHLLPLPADNKGSRTAGNTHEFVMIECWAQNQKGEKVT